MRRRTRVPCVRSASRCRRSSSRAESRSTRAQAARRSARRGAPTPSNAPAMSPLPASAAATPPSPNGVYRTRSARSANVCRTLCTPLCIANRRNAFGTNAMMTTAITIRSRPRRERSSGASSSDQRARPDDAEGDRARDREKDEDAPPRRRARARGARPRGRARSRPVRRRPARQSATPGATSATATAAAPVAADRASRRCRTPTAERRVHATVTAANTTIVASPAMESLRSAGERDEAEEREHTARRRRPTVNSIAYCGDRSPLRSSRSFRRANVRATTAPGVALGSPTSATNASSRLPLAAQVVERARPHDRTARHAPRRGRTAVRRAP